MSRTSLKVVLLLFAVVLASGQPIPDEPLDERATAAAAAAGSAVTPTTVRGWPARNLNRPIDAFAVVGCNLGPAQFHATTSKHSTNAGLIDVFVSADHVALAAADGTILTTTTLSTFVKCLPPSLLTPPSQHGCGHSGYGRYGRDGCEHSRLRAQLLGYRTRPVGKTAAQQAVMMNVTVADIAMSTAGIKITISGFTSKARKRLAGTSLVSASLVLRIKSWGCTTPYQSSWAALRTPSKFMLPTGIIKSFTETTLLLDQLTAVTSIGVDGTAYLYDLKTFSGLAGYHSWKKGGHRTTFSTPAKSKQLHNVMSLQLSEFYFINATSKGALFTIGNVMPSTVKGGREGRHLLQSSGSTTGTTSVSSTSDTSCTCNATNFYSSVNCTAVCGFGNCAGSYDFWHSECVVSGNECTSAADNPWSSYSGKTCPCQCCTNDSGKGQCSILANSGTGMYCSTIPTPSNPMPPGPYLVGAPGYGMTSDSTVLGYCTSCALVPAACMDYPVCSGTDCSGGVCTKTDCNPPSPTPASDAGCASLQCWCFGGNTVWSQICASYTQLGLSLDLCDGQCQPTALGGSQNPPWFVDLDHDVDVNGNSMTELACVGGTPSASDYDYDNGGYNVDYDC